MILSCVGILFLLIAVATITAVEYEEDESRTRTAFAKYIRRLLVTAAISLVVALVTPTTKEMAAIIVVPKIANSETAAELGEGVKTLAVEWLEELRPKKDAKN